MQHHPNNDLRRIPSEKKKGIIGTSIIAVSLFVILIVVAFAPPVPPEIEEGILVNFGTDETGMGMIEPSPPAVQEEASPPPPATATKVQNEEPLLTQNNEEAPEVKKVDPEVERKRLEKIEADRKLKSRLKLKEKRKNRKSWKEKELKPSRSGRLI